MVCFPHRRERPGKQRLQQGQGRRRRRRSPAAQEEAERGGHPYCARPEGVAQIGVFSLFALVVSLSLRRRVGRKACYPNTIPFPVPAVGYSEFPLVFIFLGSAPTQYSHSQIPLNHSPVPTSMANETRAVNPTYGQPVSFIYWYQIYKK